MNVTVVCLSADMILMQLWWQKPVVSYFIANFVVEAHVASWWCGGANQSARCEFLWRWDAMASILRLISAGRDNDTFLIRLLPMGIWCEIAYRICDFSISYNDLGICAGHCLMLAGRRASSNVHHHMRGGNMCHGDKKPSCDMPEYCANAQWFTALQPNGQPNSWLIVGNLMLCHFFW